MSLLDMLSTTGTLKRRPPAVKDASGGMTPALFFTVGTAGLPCDVQPASSNTVTKYSQKQLDVTWTVFLAETVAALEGDRFDLADGRKFKVIGARPPAPGYDEWPMMLDCVEDKNT